jgi:hypothetical protein
MRGAPQHSLYIYIESLKAIQINEASVRKGGDGTMVRRLEINKPKVGWVSAQNFIQKGHEKGAESKEGGGGGGD